MSKTRIISQLLGCKDIAPVEEDSSVEELNKHLEEMGFECNEVNSSISAFRKRMEEQKTRKDSDE